VQVQYHRGSILVQKLQVQCFITLTSRHSEKLQNIWIDKDYSSATVVKLLKLQLVHSTLLVQVSFDSVCVSTIRNITGEIILWGVILKKVGLV